MGEDMTQVRLDDKDETMDAGGAAPVCDAGFNNGCGARTIPIYPSVESQQHTFDVSLRVRAFELAIAMVSGMLKEAQDVASQAETIYAYLTKPKA